MIGSNFPPCLPEELPENHISIKGKSFIVYTVLIAIIVLAFWVTTRPRQQWQNLPLHSALEAVEALSALLMALFLYSRRDEKGFRFALPALGFVTMGILNGFHAALLPGNEFVFLRAAASFTGGLGFALVWLPASIRAVFYRAWLFWAVGALSFACSIWAVFFPAALPQMLRGADFTSAAITISIMGGVFFITGAGRFVCDLYYSGELEDFLFSIAGVLFGISGLTFEYSRLWSETWWFWHGLRLLAALLLLGFFVYRHLEIVTILKSSLFQRRQAEEALTESERRFRGIASTAFDAVIVIDNDGNVSFWNDAATRLFGYTAEEATGKYLHSLILPQCDIDEHIRGFTPFSITGDGPSPGNVCEVEALRKDGTKLTVELSMSALRLKGKWHAIGILRDITERKRIEASISARNEELQELNKELEAFSYSVAHDLRAPLRSMEGFSALLLKEHHDRLNEDGKDFLNRIKNSAQRMDWIINDLLRLSKIVRQDISLECIDLSLMVEEIAGDLRGGEEKGRTVEFVIKEDISGNADRGLMKIALENLIGNAWKFTSAVEAPRIEFGKTEMDGSEVFFIRDNGVGFSMEHAGKLFTPFQRLQKDQTFPGTGIGLSIVRRIVQRQGGRVWAEGAENAGSTFYFTLPKCVKTDELTGGNNRVLRHKEVVLLRLRGAIASLEFIKTGELPKEERSDL